MAIYKYRRWIECLTPKLLGKKSAWLFSLSVRPFARKEDALELLLHGVVICREGRMSSHRQAHLGQFMSSYIVIDVGPSPNVEGASAPR